jgi:hypothetical protein
MESLKGATYYEDNEVEINDSRIHSTILSWSTSAMRFQLGTRSGLPAPPHNPWALLSLLPSPNAINTSLSNMSSKVIPSSSFQFIFDAALADPLEQTGVDLY